MEVLSTGDCLFCNCQTVIPVFWDMIDELMQKKPSMLSRIVEFSICQAMNMSTGNGRFSDDKKFVDLFVSLTNTHFPNYFVTVFRKVRIFL